MEAGATPAHFAMQNSEISCGMGLFELHMDAILHNQGMW